MVEKIEECTRLFCPAPPGTIKTKGLVGFTVLSITVSSIRCERIAKPQLLQRGRTRSFSRGKQVRFHTLNDPQPCQLLVQSKNFPKL